VEIEPPLRIKIITMETIPSTLTMDKIAKESFTVLVFFGLLSGRLYEDTPTWDAYDKYVTPIIIEPPWTQITPDLTQD